MKPESVVETVGKYVLIDKPSSIVIDLDKSHGSWLFDSRANKFYLDCFSQYASQPLGWNHPKLLDYKEKLANIALHKVANSDMLSIPFGEFVDEFSKVTADFKYHFFIGGGTLGVENAVKAAFDWKAQKLGYNDAKANSLNVIHLREAFHGRSGYMLSTTNSPHNDNKTRLFPKFNWSRVTNPKIYFPIEENNRVAKCSNLEKISLMEIESALKKGNVAAILLEPIQGEGGDNHFRKEYFKALRQLADDYEAMLILDEVQTGVGLTGKMWAYQHFDIIPDMIAFGKKMQVCGFCSTSRIDTVPNNVFSVPFRIDSTWGGDIVDMARATIFLKIIEEDKLVQNAAIVGEYFLEGIKNLGFKNVRGRGLMIAFDLDDTQKRDEFLVELRKNVLALPCGLKSIRFRPHLTFSKEEADTAIKFLSKLV